MLCFCPEKQKLFLQNLAHFYYSILKRGMVFVMLSGSICVSCPYLSTEDEPILCQLWEELQLLAHNSSGMGEILFDFC